MSNNASEWAKQKPYIKMIKSKVAYAIARNGEKKGVWKNFEYFISSCIDKIETEKEKDVYKYKLLLSLGAERNLIRKCIKEKLQESK